jgi:mannose-1-phosphate guanylyltransferase
MQIVILAGGTGTRLWPRSRRTTPKQLLDLVDEQSMLQRTVMRVQPLVPNERIYISTGRNYAAPILEQVPEIPPENIIVEPSGKGTAPCIGLSAVHILKAGAADDDVMVTLHADAYIKDEAEFRRILTAAEEAGRRDHMVTIGITPDSAETGFGYIERGEVAERIDGRDVYAVERFTEKPDPETAQRFFESGRFYWNSGMFIWKLSRIMSEMARCQPRLHAQLLDIQEALGADDQEARVESTWNEIASETIDVGIMEKAEDVVVIPATIGWSDIGNWGSLAELLSDDPSENIARGGGAHIAVESEGCLTYSKERLIGTIGLKDMVIVDTGDAILVCHKDRAQDVKELVNKLKADGLDQYT